MVSVEQNCQQQQQQLQEKVLTSSLKLDSSKSANKRQLLVYTTTESTRTIEQTSKSPGKTKRRQQLNNPDMSRDGQPEVRVGQKQEQQQAHNNGSRVRVAPR